MRKPKEDQGVVKVENKVIEGKTTNERVVSGVSNDAILTTNNSTSYADLKDIVH